LRYLTLYIFGSKNWESVSRPKARDAQGFQIVMKRKISRDAGPQNCGRRSIFLLFQACRQVQAMAALHPSTLFRSQNA
jgi:hypothetical protein